MQYPKSIQHTAYSAPTRANKYTTVLSAYIHRVYIHRAYIHRVYIHRVKLPGQVEKLVHNTPDTPPEGARLTITSENL